MKSNERVSFARSCKYLQKLHLKSCTFVQRALIMPYIEFRTHVWLPGGMIRAPMLQQTIYENETQWEQVRALVAQMEGYVVHAVGREELHEVEDGLFRRLQELGRALLENFVAESGTGYTEGQPPCTVRPTP